MRSGSRVKASTPQGSSDLDVKGGQCTAVNVGLPAGQVTNMVTVEAVTVPLETEKSAISAVIDLERVNELRLDGPSFAKLALPSVDTRRPRATLRLKTR